MNVMNDLFGDSKSERESHYSAVVDEESKTRSHMNAHRRQVWRKNARLRVVRQMQSSQTRYNQSGYGWRTFRKVMLFLIFYLCTTDLLGEITLLLLMDLGSGREACLCSYYNDGDFNNKYVRDDFNATFTDSDGDPWTCQVQGHWESCVCNERGTSSSSNYLLLNVSSCSFLTITAFYIFNHIALVILLTLVLTSMFKMSQHCPEKDKINLEDFVLPCPSSVRETFKSLHEESKSKFIFWYSVFFVCWVVQVVLMFTYILVVYADNDTALHSLAPYELPSAFQNKEDAGSYLHYLTVCVQAVGLNVWLLANALFLVNPRLRAIFVKRDPWDPDMDASQQPQKVQVYDSRTDKTKGAIFANVTTWLPASATCKPDFELHFKLDYVDKIEKQTTPHSTMPKPKVFFTSLTGTDRSQEEQTFVVREKKSKIFGASKAIFFAVKVDPERILGRHQLVFRQDQDPVFDPDKSATSSGVDDIDGTPEEAAETLRSVDLVVSDPEADHAQLQELERRIAAVEATVAELMPQLGPIFSGLAEKKALDADRQRINDTPFLHDYYVLVQMRIVGMTVSCSAIASGMVADDSTATGGVAGDLMASGANMIDFLADQVQVIPFSNAATQLLTGGMRMYAEHQKAVRVRNCSRVFFSPTRADEIAEEVARKATIAFVDTLTRLDSFAKKAELETGKKKSTLSKMLAKAKDMAEMAQVAYADTPVKKRAEADAEALIEHVMSGNVHSDITDPHAVSDELLSVLLDSATLEKADEVGAFGAEDETLVEVEGPMPALDAQPTLYHEPTQVKDEAEKVIQFLQDGINFRKSTYGGAFVYVYTLKLNRHADELQWSRKGSSKTYNLFLDESTLVDNHDVREPKKVVVSTENETPGGKRNTAEFTFAEDLQAIRFREHLIKVLEHQQMLRREAAGMRTTPGGGFAAAAETAGSARAVAPSSGSINGSSVGMEDSDALKMPLMGAETKASEPPPSASSSRKMSFNRSKH